MSGLVTSEKENGNGTHLTVSVEYSDKWGGEETPLEMGSRQKRHRICVDLECKNRLMRDFLLEASPISKTSTERGALF